MDCSLQDSLRTFYINFPLDIDMLNIHPSHLLFGDLIKLVEE
jgi:hypothetical protein